MSVVSRERIAGTVSEPYYRSSTARRVFADVHELPTAGERSPLNHPRRFIVTFRQLGWKRRPETSLQVAGASSQAKAARTSALTASSVKLKSCLLKLCRRGFTVTFTATNRSLFHICKVDSPEPCHSPVFFPYLRKHRTLTTCSRASFVKHSHSCRKSRASTQTPEPRQWSPPVP